MVTTVSLLLNTLRSKWCKYVPVSVLASYGKIETTTFIVMTLKRSIWKNWKPENQWLFLDVAEYRVTREDCHPTPEPSVLRASCDLLTVAELTRDTKRLA